MTVADKMSNSNLKAVERVLCSQQLWGEHYLRNRDGSKRVYWPYQIDDLECPAKNIIHLDGRDVGKSINISTLALHYAFTH